MIKVATNGDIDFIIFQGTTVSSGDIVYLDGIRYHIDAGSDTDYYEAGN